MQSRDRNYDPIFYPSSHVQNGFFHFCCHESTKIRKYDWGFPPQHAMDRKNKQRKKIPLIVEVLTILTLLDFLSLIQEHRHWIKYLGIRIIVAKFNINDGVSISIPYYLNHDTPRVSNLSPPWRIYLSDLLCPLWIRGSVYTSAEVKARQASYRSSPKTLL